GVDPRAGGPLAPGHPAAVGARQVAGTVPRADRWHNAAAVQPLPEDNDDADDTLDLRRALAVVRQIERLPPADRRAHIEKACAGDEHLQRQVEGLLAGKPHPAAPGRERRGRFGRYMIDRFVGRGGMGEVYRAVQDETNRTVALKLLRDDLNSAAVL